MFCFDFRKIKIEVLWEGFCYPLVDLPHPPFHCPAHYVLEYCLVTLYFSFYKIKALQGTFSKWHTKFFVLAVKSQVWYFSFDNLSRDLHKVTKTAKNVSLMGYFVPERPRIPASMSMLPMTWSPAHTCLTLHLGQPCLPLPQPWACWPPCIHWWVTIHPIGCAGVCGTPGNISTFVPMYPVYFSVNILYLLVTLPFPGILYHKFPLIKNN